MIDQSIVFVFASIIIVATILFALICFTKKMGKRIDVEKYRARCLEIEHRLKADDPNTYQLCVLNADKLLDQALRDLGVKGNTMGERLKNSVSLYSDRNGIWTAHKLRNVIAHEPGATVSYQQAKQALVYFRQALKDLGAI